jgi:demethylspheroidene O-methyltransferase
LRDRLLTSPYFLSLAVSFSLTRFIARRRASALFDLCAGFVYSQILFACVRLGLFDILREAPQELDVLALRLSLTEDRAARLLAAADALRLVEKRGASLYGLGPLGAAVAGNPGIAAMVEHHAHLYADLSDPVALLRGERQETALGAYWPYACSHEPASLPPESVAAYSRLMALSQPLVAEEILDAYPVHRHRYLLDVGGGEGAFLAAAAARAPNLQLMLFDLPAVAERGRAALARSGLAARAEVFGGDFRSDPLPRGADLVSLVRVVLDHDDETALQILTAARQAVHRSGTLLVAEPLLGMGASEVVGAAYFNLYLLAMGRGRARSKEEIEQLLNRAGFQNVRFRKGRRVLGTGIVSATVK